MLTLNWKELSNADHTHTSFDESVVFHQDLAVLGDASCQKLNVNGELLVYDAISLMDAKINGTLLAQSDATFAEDIDCEGDLNVTGNTTLNNLTVTGTVTFPDGTFPTADVDLTGKADVNHTHTSFASLSLSGTLGVTGATTLSTVNGWNLPSTAVNAGLLIMYTELLVQPQVL
jgi:hypothetical protein